MEELNTKECKLAFVGLNLLLKNAYEKSCDGDWSCLEDIKMLDDVSVFYIHQCALECFLHNLIARKEGNNDKRKRFSVLKKG